MTQVSFMTTTERQRSAAPTEIDIRETEQLFDDFGITLTIPKFDTYYKLERWRVKKVKEYLNHYEEKLKTISA